MPNGKHSTHWADPYDLDYEPLNVIETRYTGTQCPDISPPQSVPNYLDDEWGKEQIDIDREWLLSHITD